MRGISIVFILILSLFFIGAGDKGLPVDRPNIDLSRIENKISIPVMDYEKIRKGVQNFHFFPIYFYLSTDGCISSVKEIKKEDALDLDICLGFNVIADFHHIRFEVITPDGGVYQNVDIFVDSRDSPPKMIRYNNSYTPYKIMKPFALKQMDFVKGSLPIAGSSIQTQNLIGKWRIEMYIDDSVQSTGILDFEVK